MRGKFWIAAVAVLGVILVVLGVRKWNERRGPTAAVVAFVEAIRAGDSVAAQRLLVPDNPAAQRKLDAAEWVSSPDILHRIHRLDVFRNLATVELWLSEAGYTVKPELLLRRLPNGEWKIADISNLQVDLRWTEAERRRQQEADELLARELADAMQNRAGVIVSREPASDVRRR